MNEGNNNKSGVNGFEIVCITFYIIGLICYGIFVVHIMNRFSDPTILGQEYEFINQMGGFISGTIGVFFTALSMVLIYISLNTQRKQINEANIQFILNQKEESHRNELNLVTDLIYKQIDFFRDFIANHSYTTGVHKQVEVNGYKAFFKINELIEINSDKLLYDYVINYIYYLTKSYRFNIEGVAIILEKADIENSEKRRLIELFIYNTMNIDYNKLKSLDEKLNLQDKKLNLHDEIAEIIEFKSLYK